MRLEWVVFQRADPPWFKAISVFLAVVAVCLLLGAVGGFYVFVTDALNHPRLDP